jgi:uncharacterized Zn finger protein (UPF0148 family)
MSLSLLQSYSSAEEEEEQQDVSSCDEEQVTGAGSGRTRDTGSICNKSLLETPKLSSSSLLPSAPDIFSEIAGPPKFLDNCVEKPVSDVADSEGQRWRHGRRKLWKEKPDLSAGAVLEAKAQLVGIHERIRSDVEGNIIKTPSAQSNASNTIQEGSGIKRMATATNPNVEDAATLLRMCLQCGVPKTFSNARGMICPLCGDRPALANKEKESKKTGSLIKDKERNKRMKGQSSHATWKSETEMHLRQQFD